MYIKPKHLYIQCHHKAGFETATNYSSMDFPNRCTKHEIEDHMSVFVYILVPFKQNIALSKRIYK